MKKILIDGRFIGVGDSLGRYTIEVLQNILAIDSENRYSLLIRPAGRKLIREYGFDQIENLRIEVLDIPHYSPAEQTSLFTWLNKKPYDLVHFMSFNHPILYRRPFVVTIHDLTTFGYLHLESFLRTAFFRRVMKSAAEKSKKIITISRTSKKEILENFDIPAAKIAVTLLAVDEKYLRVGKLEPNDRRRLGDKFKSEYGIGGDYLLYTGMWKRHKNLKHLIRAFQEVKNQKSKIKMAEGIQLILVGKIDHDEPEVIKEIERINNHSIDRTKSDDPVLPVGFVDENLLPAAYAGALAYVTASLNEGFGLPPLEAIACGTPAVVSKLSTFPEILGDAALFFNPLDVDDMAKKMGEIISSSKLRSDLRQLGLAQIKKYSWQKTAKETLEVYKEVLGIE
ncbi:MAG: glycosyltransferase family 1 protein [Candidatus Berkelbacteria bacterium]|nr:glycosyltransferase family 1 protein [Candidatus Berkelbacteria bacterium]